MTKLPVPAPSSTSAAAVASRGSSDRDGAREGSSRAGIGSASTWSYRWKSVR